MDGLSTVFACSGPGAGVETRQNIGIGYITAAVCAAVALALAYDAVRTRRLRLTLPIAGFMLLVHPAWTVSALHGDCGLLKRDASFVFSAFYLGLLLYQFLVSVPRAGTTACSNEPRIYSPIDSAVLFSSSRAEMADVDLNPYQAPGAPLDDEREPSRGASSPDDSFWIRVGLIFAGSVGLGAGFIAAALAIAWALQQGF